MIVIIFKSNESNSILEKKKICPAFEQEERPSRTGVGGASLSPSRGLAWVSKCLVLLSKGKGFSFFFIN